VNEPTREHQKNNATVQRFPLVAPFSPAQQDNRYNSDYHVLHILGSSDQAVRAMGQAHHFHFRKFRANRKRQIVGEKSKGRVLLSRKDERK
jgi:hypothetical protein